MLHSHDRESSLLICFSTLFYIHIVFQSHITCISNLAWPTSYGYKNITLIFFNDRRRVDLNSTAQFLNGVEWKIAFKCHPQDHDNSLELRKTYFFLKKINKNKNFKKISWVPLRQTFWESQIWGHRLKKLSCVFRLKNKYITARYIYIYITTW